MSPNEMKEKLESQIDALAGFASPAIPDSQAADYINQALVTKLNRIRLEGLEATEYNSQFIAPLKKSGQGTSIPDQTDAHKNGEIFKLPDDFYLMLSEQITTDVRDCFTGELIDEVIVFPVGEDFLSANIKNFQKNPYADPVSGTGLVWRLTFGKDSNNKYSELITDGKFNVYKYNFRYLSKPINVVIDLDNPENQVYTNIYDEFHDDIINLAALIALENMRLLSRFQTKAAINSIGGI